MMMLMGKKGKLAHAIMNAGGEEANEPNEYGYGLKSAMEKFILAVQKGNADEAADAFSDAFKICEMQPHEEFNG